MLKEIKGILSGLEWILNNIIINHIPVWTIRKILYIAQGMKIGDGARIGMLCMIIKPDKIVIDENSIINALCYIDGRGGVYIGKYSSISIYTKIISASHRVNDENFTYYEEPILIGSNVWIGCNALILNGSHIEDRAIIGANCSFSGHAAENGIYIGNPSFLLKKRELNSKYTLNYKAFFR